MIIDLIFAILSYTAAHLGFNRGLIQAVINLGGWLLAVVFAIKLTPWLTAILNSAIGADGFFVTVLLSFFILVFVFLQAINAVGKGLEGALNIAHVGVFNGLMGAAFYWALFILAYGVSLRSIDKYGLLPEAQKNGSRFYYQLLTRYTDQASNVVTYLIPIGVDGFYLFSEGVGKVDSSLRRTIPPSKIPNLYPSLNPKKPNTSNTPSDNDNNQGELHSIFDTKPPPAEQQQRRYQHAQ